MKCEVCDRQINGNNSHLIYLDDDYMIYVPEKEDYSKLPHFLGPKSEYDVMVCRECYINNNKEIEIPEYISKKQSKKWLIRKLKNES